MKIKLLKDILEFTKYQRQALQEEDIPRFDRLTNRKKEFIEQLLKMQEQNPEEKSEEFNRLVQEIKALEAENMVELKRQMEDVREELRKVREVKRGADNYIYGYAQTFSSGQYFDKK